MIDRNVLLATLGAVLANAGLALWGALYGGWSAGEILALYFLQTVLAGVFAFLRMRAAGRFVPYGKGKQRVRTKDRHISSFLFICLCFGLPALLALLMMPAVSILPSLTAERAAALALPYGAALLATLLSHLYGYLALRAERAHVTVQEAQGGYFGRIAVLAITLWCAAMFQLGPIGALVIFVLAQAFFDLTERVAKRLPPA